MVCEIVITLAHDTEWTDAQDLVQSVRNLPGVSYAYIHPDSLHLTTDFDPKELSWDRLNNEVERKGYTIAWTET
jgi:hypothetical protein